jgi:hypothetical protein
MFAWRVKEALNRPTPGVEGVLAGKLRLFWPADLEPHFRAEEEVLFTACGDVPGVGPALEEHRRLVEMVHVLIAGDAGREGNGADREGWLAFAALLTSHVRFEEDVLFPRMEVLLPGGVLDRVGGELAERLPKGQDAGAVPWK